MKSFVVCVLLLSVYGAQGQTYGAYGTANQRANLQGTATTGNIPRHATGGAIIADTIVMTPSPGVLRTPIPASSANGQSFYRDSETTVVGNTLHHTDKIHDPSLGTMVEFRYTLDLTDPNARPIVQSN